MEYNESRTQFLKTMRKNCSQEHYQESLKGMSSEDLNIVSIETGAVLQYMMIRNLPLKEFPDLIEGRLKKIWGN